MRAAGRRSPPSASVVLLAGITVIGLALRLPSFGDSLAGDELSTNFVVHGFGVDNVLGIVGSDREGTPPLFFVLTWLTKGIGGVEGLRVVSLLAGLAAIPLTYLLGLRTVGRPAATVGAALVALSPFQIFYATEARAYALVMLFCLLASLALLRALETGRVGWWVAYGLAVAAAAYTHYTSVFVLIGLFGWAFFARPEARRPLVLANLGAALLFAPWIPEFLEDSDAPAAKIIEMLHPLTLAGAKTDLLSWSLGHPLFPIGDLPGDLALWLIASGLVLGAVGLLLRLRSEDRADRWPPSAGVVLVVVLALAVPLGAALDDIVAPGIFLNRNLISSWPGLALTLGALVTVGRARFRLAAVGLLLAGFAIGAVKMLDEDNQRADYSGAAAFIERTGDPGSPVVDFPQISAGPQTSLEATFAPKGEPAPRGTQILALALPTLKARLNAARVLQLLPVPTDQQVARRAARIAGSGTLFLVTAGAAPFEQLQSVPGPVANFLSALPPGFHEVESRTFPGPGIFKVTVYVLRGDTGPQDG